ncbi:hypothetical protein CC1G_10698 [Coprinopsis cinerea okayama7|uniref:DUF6533 domain-containing protein n=1 Tax=Coprinopsis cinerea (strain Okayama-7 / 130 / ATCC MYA-4618 / FGSC 9003) TaxID=240176 RepID=A8NDS7_COPC7|nr:hypothetical protein CC1G_10698 [Coprinopsis cinerea okayama7\|eukprot:XP_001832849.2 hypothetical protein CC1G_10698 [Coprinopsis cinerea okayama7\
MVTANADALQEADHVFSAQWNVRVFVAGATFLVCIRCWRLVLVLPPHHAHSKLKLAEYIQTLELEVSLVWPSPWNHVKIVYFLNRLVPFMIIICGIYWGVALSILISELILYFRVYALSGRGRVIKHFIVINGVLIWASSLALVGKYLELGTWTTYESNSRILGCTTSSTSANHSQLIMISYAILLYSGIAMMVLSVYYGLRGYWRSKHSPLVKVFYRDGTFYFIALTVMATLNGVAAILLPWQYRFLMATYVYSPVPDTMLADDDTKSPSRYTYHFVDSDDFTSERGRANRHYRVQ